MFAFDENFAVRYGVDCAIMLQNFIFWTKRNRANGEGFHDGYWWVYNSCNAFTELFPFWTPKQVRRILSTLVERNALIKGNYNKNQFDRTLWYALSEGIMKEVFPDDPPVTVRGGADAQTVNSELPKRSTLNCPNGQMNIGTDTNQIQTRYNVPLQELPSVTPAETPQSPAPSEPKIFGDEDDTASKGRELNAMVKDFFSLWNTAVEGTRVGRVALVTLTRADKARVRLGEMAKFGDPLGVARQVMASIRDSKFCNGDNSRGWKASIDWLLANDRNWVKVYEGRYSDPEADQTEKSGAPTLEEVKAFFAQAAPDLDPLEFYAYHKARGWSFPGGVRMSDWKSAVYTWIKKSR